jgi:hypothetical protein
MSHAPSKWGPALSVMLVTNICIQHYCLVFVCVCCVCVRVRERVTRKLNCISAKISGESCKFMYVIIAVCFCYFDTGFEALSHK